MQIGQLKLLRSLCVERDPDVAVHIRELAMKSFVSVMKDIAPRSVASYSILSTMYRITLFLIHPVIISVSLLMLRRQ